MTVQILNDNLIFYKVNIFFRTNFGNKLGLGNLVRCDRLAQEFNRFGHKCFFIFDKPNQRNFTKFQSFFLYQKTNKFNQLKDAKLVFQLLKKYKSKIIILDDTRFNYDWQKFISQKKIKIVSFTEGNKEKQYADFLINYNPINYPVIKKNFYVSCKKNCKYLIHPKYCIISKKKIVKNYKFKKKFYFTFYLGGGGDLNIFKKILIKLSKTQDLKMCKFLVIIGLFAKNKQVIKNLTFKNNSIEFFDKGKNIDFIIKKSNFFIGTAGTSLFETSYLNTPSIMFKFAQNQLTDAEALQNIGHYFYLDIQELKNIEKIIKLLISIKKNYSRIKNLFKNPRLKIDNSGSKRIVKEILNYKIRKKINQKIFPKNKSNTFLIRKVEDKDLNHYLNCRNLKINRENSRITQPINKVDHYNWWFKTNRKSFLLTRGEKKILYFYKEKLFFFNEKDYYLSGWFACTKKCEARDILYALNWQRKQDEGVKWISFVKNNNILSLKMSKYIGWKKMTNSDLMIKMTRKKLKLKKQKFTYFYR